MISKAFHNFITSSYCVFIILVNTDVSMNSFNNLVVLSVFMFSSVYFVCICCVLIVSLLKGIVGSV